MMMRMIRINNHASKEISANHDQYDVAAVADDDDEDNHNLSPIIHRHLSTLIPQTTAKLQLSEEGAFAHRPNRDEKMGRSGLWKDLVLAWLVTHVFGKKLLIEIQKP